MPGKVNSYVIFSYFELTRLSLDPYRATISETATMRPSTRVLRCKRYPYSRGGPLENGLIFSYFELAKLVNTVRSAIRIQAEPG